MRLLDLPQAKHFCAPSMVAAPPVSNQSLVAFHGSTKGIVLLHEGTLRFRIHQVSLLSSVERWLVYSLGHYRRSIDMLVPVSAPWAQVTLYYASFFAANAILGMFGCWIGQTHSGNLVVDVERGIAGSQELRIHRRLASPSGARGSHRVFWDFFYDGVAAIAAWVPKDLSAALSPVNGDFAWQIVERNEVNYDMFQAWAASSLLYNTFKPVKLNSLRGPLALQLEATERMVKLALYFANEVSLSLESLAGCGARGTRQQIQRRLVSQSAPKVVAQSGLQKLLET